MNLFDKWNKGQPEYKKKLDSPLAWRVFFLKYGNRTVQSPNSNFKGRENGKPEQLRKPSPLGHDNWELFRVPKLKFKRS